MKNITLIAPCYNEEKNLDSFFNSLLNQSNKNFDLVIVDDWSKDNSKNIILKYSNLLKNQNINLLLIDWWHNWPANAKKIAIEQSNTTYIAIVDTDEELEKNYFLNFYNFLNNNSDFNFLSWKILSKNNWLLSLSSNLIYNMFYNKRTYWEWKYIKWLAWWNIIINKIALYELGGYPNSKTWIAEDILLSQMIISKNLKINFLQDLLVYHADPKNIYSYLVREYKFWIWFNLSLIKWYKFWTIELFKLSSLWIILSSLFDIYISLSLFLLYILIIYFYLFKSNKKPLIIISWLQLFLMNTFWSIWFIKWFFKYALKKS